LLTGDTNKVKSMALTDTGVRSLKAKPTPKKYSDGGGLHLLVMPTGSKLWRLAYRFDGRQKTLALGSYPAVTLSDARKRRDDAKKVLVAGTDPSQERRLERLANVAARAVTFSSVTDEFVAKQKREGKASATTTKKRWLLDLALTDLGERPIGEITAPEILATLRKVEAKGNYETARRMRAAISQVFRYAIATARAENDPTFGLKGALTAHVVKHRPAVTSGKAFSGLVRAVWGYDGAPETLAALKLMTLLYPRPGELRQAEWREFDLDKATWAIPAHRTKMRREHRKPLSAAAVAILRDLQRLTGAGPLVFPGVHSRHRPISENTLNGALRRLGFAQDQASAHGFRASASILLNESGKWSADAIEAELAHVGGDDVRRAYHRGLHWDERVSMAEWWSGELETMRTGL
jgi:integrase